METACVLKEKLSQAEQIRRLEQVTADEDKYFSGVLGSPVTFAARWGVALSKRYRTKASKPSAPAAPSKNVRSLSREAAQTEPPRAKTRAR